MLNIIKTAIITIIISFISGLLLDYYKNLAPRILCSIRNIVPLNVNGEKVYAYIVTVSNISNKIIHELTINMQNSKINLKIKDAKITRGLKFDSSTKDNILDFYIPFLGKGDKFSVTLYTEDNYSAHIKPAVAIRSPENFKRVNSINQNGILHSLLNLPANIKQFFSDILSKNGKKYNTENDSTKVMDNPLSSSIDTSSHKKNNTCNKSKKAAIIAISIVLVMAVGVIGKSYLKKAFVNKSDKSVPTVKNSLPNNSNNINGNSRATNESMHSKSSSGNTTENSNSKSSTGNSTGNNISTSSTKGSSGNTGTQSNSAAESQGTGTSSGDSSGNVDSKTSSGNSSTIAPSKTTDNPTGTSDTKTSPGSSNGNTGN